MQYIKYRLLPEKNILDDNKSFAVESTLSGKNIINIINRAKKQNYKQLLGI